MNQGIRVSELIKADPSIGMDGLARLVLSHVLGRQVSDREWSWTNQYHWIEATRELFWNESYIEAEDALLGDE